MPSAANRIGIAATTSVAAAIGSAVCCAGPLLVVALGVSGAGLAATFDPLRPYFIAGTAVSLASGFAVLHREERNACEPGKACASPVARRHMKWVLWIATALAIPLVTFSWWSRFLLT